MAHDDRAQDLVVIVGVVILLQDSEALARRDLDCAACRLNVACQQFEEGGLAGTVRADDAVAVAGGKLQVDLLKKNAASKLHGKIGNRDHTTIMHGIDKIEKEINNDENLKNTIETLKKKINPQG